MVNITNYYYDLSNTTANTDLLTYISAVNDLTGQFFMFGVLIIGWLILFMSMKSVTSTNKEAMAASSFITSVLSIFFLTLGFINMGLFLFIVIPAGLLFVGLMFQRDY